MAPAPAPVYSGQAEVLALRALVERSEGDRAFYRNLALILFGVLILTLVLVVAWTLALGNPDAAPPADSAVPVPSRPAPSATLATLDEATFATKVQPIPWNKIKITAKAR